MWSNCDPLGITIGVLFPLLLSSCLKETAVPIESIFSIEASDDKTSPVTIRLKNESYGADEYEWIFEGGVPNSSKERNPGKVVFTQAGEHRITLRVWNAVDERINRQSIRVDSAMTVDFDFSIAVNNIAPGVVTIVNKSTGGAGYEWTFKGGTPTTSNRQHPDTVTFAAGGEHSIRLKVFNGSKYEEVTKTFTLRAPMKVDFSYESSAVDRDWEAPLTLTTTNLTTGGLSYSWVCEGATVLSPTSQTTDVRFEQAGTYKLKLIAGNGKEEKRMEKTIHIKANSGIANHRDLQFGINEAKNTIGCFFSVKEGGVLTSDKIARDTLGTWVDFGLFALNSSFNYCYFFSPTRARANSFPEIAGARGATFMNDPVAAGLYINDAVFEQISKASDLNRFVRWAENNQTSFNKSSIPHFVLVRTSDGRRGIIRVKQYVADGVRSYIVADVKFEKRIGE